MKTLLLLTLLASAQSSQVCDVCRNITHVIDHYDPTTIADSICPLIGEFEDVCEDILPPIVEWMQTTGELDMICIELCANGEDYDYFGDYDNLDLSVARHEGHHPFDIPHEETVDLSVTRHEGHHPFDIPHEETVDLHETRHEGHHPFDIPHEETVDLSVARSHGHHPFDIPHEETPEIISVGEAETDIH